MEVGLVLGALDPVCAAPERAHGNHVGIAGVITWVTEFDSSGV